MEAGNMRSFWDARAREDPFHYVDSRQPYGEPDPDRFWAEGERDLDTLLGLLDLAVRQEDLVLDIGCGIGRLTRALAARAGHVIALDVSPEMLRRARELNARVNNVTWLLGDGETLAGVDDASVDAAVSHVVFEHIPSPRVTLGYVAELGRVLRPGGWAAFGLSTDPALDRARPRQEQAGTSRRELLRGLTGRRPKEQAEWIGAFVPLDALGAVATQAGLTLERIEGANTRFTYVRAERTAR